MSTKYGRECYLVSIKLLKEGERIQIVKKMFSLHLSLYTLLIVCFLTFFFLYYLHRTGGFFLFFLSLLSLSLSLSFSCLFLL